MDEVIADALAEHLLRYNRDFSAALTLADLHGRYLWDLIPERHHHVLAGYMASDDFFSVLDVMPDSQRVLARLQTRYDIFIATAAMEVPTSFSAKFQWLAEHFPFIPPSHIVFCGDKSILRADFLIDDNPPPASPLRNPRRTVRQHRQRQLPSPGHPLHRPRQHPRPRLSPRRQLAGNRDALSEITFCSFPKGICVTRNSL